jgi:carbonic anhydrase
MGHVQQLRERRNSSKDLLKFDAAGIVSLGFGDVSWQAHAAKGAPTALSADEALDAMKSGNERYVSHPELCSNDLAQRRSAVAGRQAPWVRRSSAVPTVVCRWS